MHYCAFLHESPVANVPIRAFAFSICVIESFLPVFPVAGFVVLQPITVTAASAISAENNASLFIRTPCGLLVKMIL